MRKKAKIKVISIEIARPIKIALKKSTFFGTKSVAINKFKITKSLFPLEIRKMRGQEIKKMYDNFLKLVFNLQSK
jgi:hypothetical protein